MTEIRAGQKKNWRAGGDSWRFLSFDFRFAIDPERDNRQSEFGMARFMDCELG
jgi:hypothetical protein